MRCGVCLETASAVRTQRVLGKFDATYCKCTSCGFMWAQDPVWLEEAYSSAIAIKDTGTLARVQRLLPSLTTLLALTQSADERVLDIGGGYGVLVRALRDVGFDARWEDPYCDNLLARGFEYLGDGAASVIAVEVIEHAVDPVDFLRETFDRTGARLVVATTEVLPEPVPPADWWYFTPDTGQHISFFERRTMAVLAERVECHALSRANFHVFAREPLARWKFMLAATRLARGSAAIVRINMRSRTDSDGEMLGSGSS